MVKACNDSSSNIVACNDSFAANKTSTKLDNGDCWYDQRRVDALITAVVGSIIGLVCIAVMTWKYQKIQKKLQ